MKFYLDSADARQWALPAGCPPVQGVTTNPTLVMQAGLPVSLPGYLQLVAQAGEARDVPGRQGLLDQVLLVAGRLHEGGRQHREQVDVLVCSSSDGVGRLVAAQRRVAEATWRTAAGAPATPTIRALSAQGQAESGAATVAGFRCRLGCPHALPFPARRPDAPEPDRGTQRP